MNSKALLRTFLAVPFLFFLANEVAAQQYTITIEVRIRRDSGQEPQEPQESIKILTTNKKGPDVLWTDPNGTKTITTFDDGRWDFQAIKEGFEQEDPPAWVVIEANTKTYLVSPKPIKLHPSPVGQGAINGKIVLVLYQQQPQEERKGAQPPSCSTTELTGTITHADRSSKVLAEVAVYVFDQQSNKLQFIRSAKTAKECRGFYWFAFPEMDRYAQYIITIKEEGYSSKSLILKRCEVPPAEILLEKSDEADKDAAPLVETTEPARRYVVSPRVMQSLPLPGWRAFDSLALMAPGVLPPPATSQTTGPGVSPGVGAAGQFAVNGLRSRENNFSIDGSDNNDEDIGARRQGFITLTPQPVETLKEFQIITALPDARFGRNIGAQVNALSKSGSNDVHGNVYGFLTDQLLNARDFFDLRSKDGPPPVPLRRASDGAPVRLDGHQLVFQSPVGDEDPMTRSQTGFAVGRHLKDQTTLLFVSLERQIIHASKESNFAVPTLKQRGVFDTGDTGLKAGATPLLPASLPGNAIFSLYPFPNNPIGPYGANTYTTVLPADGNGTRFSIKLDHQVGEPNKTPKAGEPSGSCRSPRKVWRSFWCVGDTLSARLNTTGETSILPVTGDALFSSLRPKVQTQNLAIFYNRSLSHSTADTMRFSMGRTQLRFLEVRDPYLLPSSVLPETQFLLNAPLVLNLSGLTGAGSNSSPQLASAASPEGAALLSSLGYRAVTQSEQLTGPLGQVLIPGFSPIGVDVFSFPQKRANLTFQVAETLSHVQGSHLFTMGFDLRRTHINSSLDRNFRPIAIFSGLRNLGSNNLLPLTNADGSQLSQQVLTGTTLAAAGIPTGLFQTFAVNPESTVEIRFNQISLFLQDEIRLTRNLRLSLGLRYDVNTVPETVGRQLEGALRRENFAKLVEEVCGPDCRIPFGGPENFKSAYGGDLNDFDPRVGFAWDPLGNGKLSVRGGFGVYAGQFSAIVIDQSRNIFPAYVPINLANFSPRSQSGTFLFNLANPSVRSLLPALNVVAPGTLNQIASGVNPISLLGDRLFDLKGISLAPTIPVLNLVLPQSGLKTPYSYHYALTVERKIFRDYILSVAFVGTRGVKLLRMSTPFRGANRSSIEFLRGSAVTPLTAAAPFPFFQGSMESAPEGGAASATFKAANTLFESSASSTYNALQVEVNRRYSHHFQIATSLTYSHAIDDASDFFDNAGAFALPQNSLARSERSSSNFDARFRAVVNFVWDLPFKEDNGLFGGWQFAGIMTAQTGQPFTVNSSTDVNRDGNLTDRLDATSGLISHPVKQDRRISLQLAPGTNPGDLLASDGKDGRIGRNTFRAPGIANVDLAIVKSFASLNKVRFADQSKVSFRVEIFNLFNRPQFSVPVRILESPSFGSSVSTNSPARMIQLALKIAF